MRCAGVKRTRTAVTMRNSAARAPEKRGAEIQKTKREIADVTADLEANEQRELLKNSDLTARSHEPSDHDLAVQQAAFDIPRHRIKLLEGAVAVLEGKLEADKQKLSEKDAQVKSAAAVMVAEMQAWSFEQVPQVVEQLRPFFADLLATDILRHRYCGSAYPTPEGVEPAVSGTILVKNFLEKISSRLRPVDFTLGMLQVEAERIANTIIEDIEGN